MKATISWLGAILVALTLTTATQAWWGQGPAPDGNAFTPNWYCYPCWGGWGGGSNAPYGNWPPSCQPFQGFAPPPSGGAMGSMGFMGFATHPFARSPRDYFMVEP